MSNDEVVRGAKSAGCSNVSQQLDSNVWEQSTRRSWQAAFATIQQHPACRSCVRNSLFDILRIKSPLAAGFGRHKMRSLVRASPCPGQLSCSSCKGADMVTRRVSEGIEHFGMRPLLTPRVSILRDFTSETPCTVSRAASSSNDGSATFSDLKFKHRPTPNARKSANSHAEI